jgi:hypothetical protein
MAMPQTHGEAPVAAASKWWRRTGKVTDAVPGTSSPWSSEPAQAPHSTGTSPARSPRPNLDSEEREAKRLAALSPVERMRDEYAMRDPWIEHWEGIEALRLARQAAKADPPRDTWAAEPYCQECPGCGEPHRKLVDLVRCRHADWEQEESAWTPCTFVWWCIREEAPEALHGTSPDALGRRLVREGWEPRWVGNLKGYYYEDLPEEAAKAKPKARKTTRRR